MLGPYARLADGIAAAKVERFDGALLDFNLAGELAEPLADFLIAHGVPFVFLTGYQRDSIDRRYANVPLLQKPIEPESLERVLVSLLDAPEPLQAAEADLKSGRHAVPPVAGAIPGADHRQEPFGVAVVERHGRERAGRRTH